MARANQVCEHLHLPGAVRQRPDPGGHAPRLRPAAAISTSSAACGHASRTGPHHRPDRRFPGETEADFADTLSLVEECRFDGAFTFVYSPRRQTEAARLPGRLDPRWREERMQRLVEAGAALGREQQRGSAGPTVEVMVERAEPPASGRSHGADPGAQAGQLLVRGASPADLVDGGTAGGHIHQLSRARGHELTAQLDGDDATAVAVRAWSSAARADRGGKDGRGSGAGTAASARGSSPATPCRCIGVSRC